METLSWFLLGFLINLLWQAPVVVFATILCDRLIRDAPASIRHWLWVTAFIFCLLLPLLGATDPDRFSVGGESAPVPQTETKNAHSPEAIGIQDAWQKRFEGLQSAPLAPTTRMLTVAVVGVFLLSLLCHLVKFLRAWQSTKDICGSGYARDIPESIAQAVLKCRASFSLGSISILSSSNVTAPMTLGVFRPIIILPEHLFDSAPIETQPCALGHEMAHIRRRDFALNLIYQLLSLPVAFHPAVALIKRRINQTRELACDEMVADHLIGARTYARSLVYLAGMASNPGRSNLRYD